MRLITLVSAGLLVAAGLPAQTSTGSRSAVIVERYGFDPGLAYSSVTQVTLPVTASADLGERVTLAVSGGLTWVRLAASDGSAAEPEITGLVDTEARLLVALVPERLTLLLTGVVPTGTEALDVDDLGIAGVLTNRAIGFAVPNLGSGGQAGGGFVGAIPWGRMALGLGATYTHSVAYSPVVGRPGDWKPGGQWRLRTGIEGSVGPRTYLRTTAVFVLHGEDALDDVAFGTPGHQFHGYVSVNQGTDAGSLTLYVMDSYRSAPQIEATSLGPVRLPKGNLLSLGGRMEFLVGRTLRLVPRVEYRRLGEAPPDAGGTGALEAAGSTLRIGSDLRVPVGSRLALVFEGSGLFGNVGDGAGSTVGVRGIRAGVHLALVR
jgi:hypothetical protein